MQGLGEMNERAIRSIYFKRLKTRLYTMKVFTEIGFSGKLHAVRRFPGKLHAMRRTDSFP